MADLNDLTFRPLSGASIRTVDATQDEVRDRRDSSAADECDGCGSHPFPAPDLASRSAHDFVKRRNTEGAVGNGGGDEQCAGVLAEIAPSSSGHDKVNFATDTLLAGRCRRGTTSTC